MNEQTQVRIQGVALSPGRALGRPCIYRDPVHETPSTAICAETETARLSAALNWMDQRLAKLSAMAGTRVDANTAAIFEAARAMLTDQGLRERFRKRIHRRGLSAEAAVVTAFKRYQTALARSGSEYLRERVADLLELQRGLLGRLSGVAPMRHCAEASGCDLESCSLGNPHILVTEELTAGVVLQADHHTLGFLAERCGHNSHAAILARALGRPVVSGVKFSELVTALPATLWIDGDSGETILNPDPARLPKPAKPRQTSAPASISPGLNVLASIDRAEDVARPGTAAAAGIGMYRTEIEALTARQPLDEATQTRLYSRVVQAMQGRPVHIRLFDFGADKAPSWLNLPPESNPALGCRGTRLLLARPELLAPQARAIARAAAHGPVHVVYPMIVDLPQFNRIRAAFATAIADLPAVKLFHGPMFEVPSACLQARALLEASDFGCIGSNDLLQYYFAADRSNDWVDQEALLANPLLWELVASLAAAAKQADKPLLFCGEAAANPSYAGHVAAAGINTVCRALA